MKKIIYITTLFFAFIIMTNSCGNGSEGLKIKGSELTFDSIVVDTMVTLTNHPASPKAEIHLNIKYVIGEGADAINDSILRSGILTPDYLATISKKLSPKEAIDTFVLSYIKDYRHDWGALYQRDQEHVANYNMQYSSTANVLSKKEGIINYIAEMYSYAGGAHGMQWTVVKNIDAKTGHVLTFQDVFVPGSEVGLTEKIVEDLCKQNDVKDLKALQSKGIFANMQPYTTDNFILEDDNVVFIYSDSEIAPHAVGNIKVKIDASEFLKK